MTCPVCAGPVVASARSGDPFVDCTSCGRAYRRTDDGVLVERWLGPLSLVLYSAIFTDDPVALAPRVAAELRSQQSPDWVAMAVGEIRRELASPTQPVRDIVGCHAGEAELRAYLAAVADLLSR
jgi:hypothetical protein